MLSKSQYNLISKSLNSDKLQDEVAVEMIDHYATSIENMMLHGTSFEAAMNAISKELKQEEVEGINKQFKKNKMIKKMIKSSPIIGIYIVVAVTISAQLLSQEEKWLQPLKNMPEEHISSEFGYRMHPVSKSKKLHTGIDYKAPIGTSVNAVKSGIILITEHNDTGYGNKIVIEHYDGTKSVYAHLNKIMVNKNDSVKGGELIAEVGNSGAALNPHLHFEMIKEGKKINPKSVDKIFAKKD